MGMEAPYSNVWGLFNLSQLPLSFFSAVCQFLLPASQSPLVFRLCVSASVSLTLSPAPVLIHFLLFCRVEMKNSCSYSAISSADDKNDNHLINKCHECPLSLCCFSTHYSSRQACPTYPSHLS